MNTNRRRQFILLTILIILSLPWIGMQFSDEVNWSFFDFAVAGILLLSTGLGIDWIFSKIKTSRIRLLFIGITLLLLALVWAELAVGIFGTPLAGN